MPLLERIPCSPGMEPETDGDVGSSGNIDDEENVLDAAVANDRERRGWIADRMPRRAADVGGPIANEASTRM